MALFRRVKKIYLNNKNYDIHQKPKPSDENIKDVRKYAQEQVRKALKKEKSYVKRSKFNMPFHGSSFMSAGVYEGRNDKFNPFF